MFSGVLLALWPIVVAAVCGLCFMLIPHGLGAWSLLLLLTMYPWASKVADND